MLGWIEDVFTPFARVKVTVENVASMDQSARLQISYELDIIPIKLDPADCLPHSRPRFAWSREMLEQMEGLTLYPEQEFFRAYVQAEGVEYISGSDQGGAGRLKAAARAAPRS